MLGIGLLGVLMVSTVVCFREVWGICADCCFKVPSGSTDELGSFGLDVSDKVSDKAIMME